MRKNILLTGCSRGVGLVTAKTLLNNGYNVYGVSRKLTKEYQELITSFPDQAFFKSYNLANVEDIQNELFKKFISNSIPLHGVINNAGLGGESSLETMSNDAWNLVMDVTLNGAMKMMRAAIPILKETQGVIVNNASVLGWRAQAGQSHYAAAKAGVMALTRCVAMETVEHGIRINAVAPSLAMNPHLAKTSSLELIDSLSSQEAYGRGAEPWEVANVILFLASDLSSYMTGEVISVSSQRA